MLCPRSVGTTNMLGLVEPNHNRSNEELDEEGMKKKCMEATWAYWPRRQRLDTTLERLDAILERLDATSECLDVAKAGGANYRGWSVEMLGTEFQRGREEARVEGVHFRSVEILW